MAGRGRPTIYDREQALEICRRMAGGESLRSICAPDGMPNDTTVRGWAVEDRDGFFVHYDAALRIRAMRWAEEVVEIADDASEDVIVDEDGKERPNTEFIARSRLRVDTRKWVACKLLPKVYGEKQQHEHSGGVNISVVTGIDREAE